MANSASRWNDKLLSTSTELKDCSVLRISPWTVSMLLMASSISDLHGGNFFPHDHDNDLFCIVSRDSASYQGFHGRTIDCCFVLAVGLTPALLSLGRSLLTLLPFDLGLTGCLGGFLGALLGCQLLSLRPSLGLPLSLDGLQLLPLGAFGRFLGFRLATGCGFAFC